MLLNKLSMINFTKNHHHIKKYGAKRQELKRDTALQLRQLDEDKFELSFEEIDRMNKYLIFNSNIQKINLPVEKKNFVEKAFKYFFQNYDVNDIIEKSLQSGIWCNGDDFVTITDDYTESKPRNCVAIGYLDYNNCDELQYEHFTNSEYIQITNCVINTN